MADISVIKVNNADYTIKDATARAALEGKAPLASPTFTGTPTVPTPDTNDDSTKIANTAWVKDRIAESVATADAMIFKGTIGKTGATITTKTLPNDTAKVGWTYKAVDAGSYTVGTGTGTGTTTVVCEAGDMIIATSDGSASTYATWTVAQANIDGAVTGPASSTDAHVAIFEGISGKEIKDSGYTIGKSVPSDAVFTDTKYTDSKASTLTAVATAGTTPSWSASVSDETLSFSFSAGAMPTFTTGDRVTGISAT